MRLLLDEGTPWRLRRLLRGHDVATTQYMGWDGKDNGELLALARDEFDALVTLDRGIQYQQHITEEDVSVIVVHGTTNHVRDLEPLVPKVLEALRDLKRGQVVLIR